MPQFIKKCYAALEGNAAQAQHMVPEHTHSMAVTADNSVPTVSDDVNHDDDRAHDEWLEELYAAEELGHAEREAEEGRSDH